MTSQSSLASITIEFRTIEQSIEVNFRLYLGVFLYNSLNSTVKIYNIYI